MQILSDVISFNKRECKYYQMVGTFNNRECKYYQKLGTLNNRNFKFYQLGDNCIQNFDLGRYIIGYTVLNLVLPRPASGDVKRDFRTYIR